MLYMPVCVLYVCAYAVPVCVCQQAVHVGATTKNEIC